MTHHHLTMNTTLRDAQNDVVLSLLPRTHAVTIDGVYVGAGTITALRPTYVRGSLSKLRLGKMPRGWGERIEGPYATQGKCDGCDAQPWELVNQLTRCACSVGIGAPVPTCSCPWGKQERAKARQRAQGQTGEAPQPPQCHHAETGENPVPRGLGDTRHRSTRADREFTAGS